jgi:hypothetical protein
MGSSQLVRHLHTRVPAGAVVHNPSATERFVASGSSEAARMAHRSLLTLSSRLRRQYGVLTVAQATEDGVDRRELRRLREAGLLVPLQLRVLRCPLVGETWETRALAAQLAAGPQAALGRWSAARLLGLVEAGSRSTELDLVQPSSRNLRAAIPRPRRSSRILPEDVVSVGHFRCTSAAWTLVDLVAVATPGTVERVAGRALAEKLVTRDAIVSLSHRLRNSDRGPHARWLLSATTGVIPGSRSRDESGFVELVVEAGLPAPAVNHPVVDASGRRRELDSAWPEWGVAVELDLHPSHATTVGRRADGRRQNDLIHEWTLLRFDAHDLSTDPGGVVQQVGTALRRAGWRPG